MSSSIGEPRPGGRRALAVAVVVLAAVSGLVVVGRWEGRRDAREQVEGMSHTLALIGPLDAPSLAGFRILPEFDCLVYRRGANPFALEMCVDAEGRVVETIDRRTETRHISSLRYDPASSTLRVDRREVDRLLRRMTAG